MNKTILTLAGFLTGLVLGVYIFVSLPTVTVPGFGSVAQGNDYSYTRYTSTVGTAAAVLKGSGGSLGSFIVTGANTGNLTLYAATTSDVTKRALATSSLTVIADFPASLAAGDYVFDISFPVGLLAVWNGLPATSTLTWR